MSLVTDYLTDVKSEIDGGVEFALELYAKPKLIEKIHDYSFKKVYGKPDGYTRADGLTRRAENARRYTIGVVEDNDVSIEGNELTIRLEKEMQSGELGEVEIVEEGTSHNQPYPRPFLQPAVDDYAFYDIDLDMAEGFGMLGFEATTNGAFDAEIEGDLPY